MVVTTGNKSEMSVGYATLYGDMNGGFNPIKDLYKMQVYAIARWRNHTVPRGAYGPGGEVNPQNIIDKAPSAELRPNQTDQDSLPPYPILDDILECLVEGEMSVEDIVARGHDVGVVHRIEHLLYLAEYKRRQSAPGVKITRKNFGRDRRYPITNRSGIGKSGRFRQRGYVIAPSSLSFGGKHAQFHRDLRPQHSDFPRAVADAGAVRSPQLVAGWQISDAEQRGPDVSAGHR